MLVCFRLKTNYGNVSMFMAIMYINIIKWGPVLINKWIPKHVNLGLSTLHTADRHKISM